MKTSYCRVALSVRAIIIACLVGRATCPASGASPSTAVSATVATLTIPCLGSSDTIVSTPVDRAPAYAGNGLPSINGSVTKIVFSAVPFTTSQFKYNPAVQPNTYFARMVGGPKAGGFYTITDNDTTSVTLDLNGDNLSAVTSTNSVQIIPYWTLNTLFPSGKGVTASNGFVTQTQILLPDTTKAGTDLAATSSYFYSGRGASWYNTGTGSAANDVVLYPDNFFIVRNNGSAATSLTVAGGIVSTSLAIPLLTSTSSQQDNAIAISRPVPVTLNDSGLISSGAFKASSGFVTGDQLLVFDNAVPGFNKAATAVYTYVGGAWRKSGTTGDVGSDAVFAPGTGVIIRKQITSNGATAVWINPSTY